MNPPADRLDALRFGPIDPQPIPDDLPLVLASSSPRRRLLLAAAGYEFSVEPPDDAAECGICSRETPPELVGRLAVQKAADVAKRTSPGLVLGADTVAECVGQTLGKPANREHAREMLQLLRGRPHSVYTGVCLWSRPGNRMLIDVVRTQLRMEAVSDSDLEEYLDSGRWEGKAGAFGYQDGNDWLRVVEGSESNIIGLPMERLAELLRGFAQMASHVDPDDV
jgi:septum formation protein